MSALLEHKQQGHRDQHHVVEQGTPLTRLVVGQTTLAPGLLSDPLDPEPVRLQLRQAVKRCHRWMALN